MAGSDTYEVIDTAMLQWLAVIAAANHRSIRDELNRAVKTYILKEFAEQGEAQLVERALLDQPTPAQTPATRH